MNFLHGLQDHIKVTILMLANLAKTFPNAYNKNPKWQSINRNKITPKIEFQQTNPTLQTKTTQGCQIILETHPKSTLPKFNFFALAAISPNSLWAGSNENKYPMLQ